VVTAGHPTDVGLVPRHSCVNAEEHRQEFQTLTDTRRSDVNGTIVRNLTRYLALPLVAAGIAGGAILGSAGAANAAPSISANDHGNFHAPSIRATPPTMVQPGARWHRHHHRGGFDFGD
jgi:hypothetical protein